MCTKLIELCRTVDDVDCDRVRFSRHGAVSGEPIIDRCDTRGVLVLHDFPDNANSAFEFTSSF